MRALLLVAVLLVGTGLFPPSPLAGEGSSHETVTLAFFWSKTCPHCLEAKPAVAALAAALPWLRVESHEVSDNPENVLRYQRMARLLGREAQAVPAFLFCGEMLEGFGPGTPMLLQQRLTACHDGIVAPPSVAPVVVPLVGAVDPQSLSLPLLTVVLAGLDAFNPCAFFVLLFLLSLMAHARSRARMLLVGGVFVLCSGVIYFLFMAAWLNLFLLTGRITFVTAAAGVLALVVGGLNVKDYFLWGRGPSLAIPDSAKPGLFARMRGLVAAESLAPLLGGTLVLAIAANSYELLCTAGFPMVYTRLLTLHALPSWQHYLYLAAYNAVYVLPLLAIVGGFVLAMGGRRLSEAGGRRLKLVSGLMMAALGATLLAAPEALNDVRVAVGLPLGALAVAAVLGLLWPPHRPSKA